MYFFIVLFIGLVLFMVVYGRYLRLTEDLKTRRANLELREEKANLKMEGLKFDIETLQKQISEKELELHELKAALTPSGMFDEDPLETETP